jgi:hypothetical protein
MNNDFNAHDIDFAYGRSNQVSPSYNNANDTNSVDIQSIPAKKVHVGDIKYLEKPNRYCSSLVAARQYGYVGSHSIEAVICKPHHNHI